MSIPTGLGLLGVHSEEPVPAQTQATKPYLTKTVMLPSTSTEDKSTEGVKCKMVLSPYAKSSFYLAISTTDCMGGVYQLLATSPDEIDVVQLSGASKWTETQMDLVRVAGECLISGVNQQIARGLKAAQNPWQKQSQGTTLDPPADEEMGQDDFQHQDDGPDSQSNNWGYGATAIISVGMDRELSAEDYKPILGAIREFAREIASRVVQASLEAF